MTAAAVRRLVRVLVFVALSALAVVATWTWGVNPVGTWFDQRDEIAQLEARLIEVRESNAALAAEIDLLQTDAEIERIARRPRAREPGRRGVCHRSAGGRGGLRLNRFRIRCWRRHLTIRALGVPGSVRYCVRPAGGEANVR